MSDLITMFSSLFTFLITQLGNVAGFFTSNTIGQLLLGLGVFTLVFNIVLALINKLK